MGPIAEAFPHIAGPIFWLLCYSALTCCGYGKKFWPSWLNLRWFFTVFVFIYARVLYDISVLAPPLSQQWFAELFWWTKFNFMTGLLWIDTPPLSLDTLQHHHSKINVIDLHASNTSFTEFLKMTKDNALTYNNVIVLRDIFSQAPDNQLQFLNTTEAFKKYMDLDQVYQTMVFPKNKQHKVKKYTFREFLDLMPQTDEQLTTLMFHYGFLESQKWLLEQYENLWEALGSGFTAGTAPAGTAYSNYRSHTFLYHGTKYRTRLHAAPPMDYFLQIANTKKWRFIHKRYMPYLGGWRIMPQGVMGTPDYFLDDYPKDKPGIPFTEVILNPGDIMFFTTWHMHEVFNTEPEKLGFAIGMRPWSWTGRYTDEQFAPLALYNFVCVWGMIHHTFLAGTFDFKKRLSCRSETLRNSGRGFNGSTITRFEYRPMPDGECQYYERGSDYQQKELRGELDWKQWYPKTY